jgi:hypothetical protein
MFFFIGILLLLLFFCVFFFDKVGLRIFVFFSNVNVNKFANFLGKIIQFFI